MKEEDIEVVEEEGADGIPKLMEGLQEALDSSEEEMAEAILDARLRMSSDKNVCKALGGFLGSTLAETLKVFMEEAVVIEVLLAVLTKILLTSEQQNAFGSEANIDLLMKAMTTHKEGEETLIEYSCLVIEKLAVDNESVGKILLENGAEQQLTDAESIITNVRNKKYVGQARTALKLS